MKLYKHTNGTCNASGPAIRALREKAGISQEQLAAKLQLAGLNLNQKAVSRIETGDRVVPDFELNYFATVLGVPVCTLLEYEKWACEKMKVFSRVFFLLWIKQIFSQEKCIVPLTP